jgi:hypothetical protein
VSIRLSASPAFTVRRAQTRNIELSAWAELVTTNPTAAKKSFSVTVSDAKGDPHARWHITGGMPTSVTVTQSDAGDLIETAVFSADSIQRVAI